MNSLNFLPVLLANLGLAFLANAAMSSQQPPIIINETISMAKGAYVRVADVTMLKRGDIIALPMTSSAKAYLTKELAYPDKTLLIKRVAGLSGDVMCRRGTTVTINAQTVHAFRRDRFGTLLPYWGGCHVLLEQEVFLLGDHPSSFDSRYFGPVTKDQLIGTYRGVMTW
jgi:conjugative transfer signal peptidase TraF